MKPASIKKFDLFYWAAVAIGLLGALLSWNDNMAMMDAELAQSGVNTPDIGMGAMVGGIAFGLFINAVLWALISVLRIEIIKWVLLVFTLWGVIALSITPVAIPMVSLITSTITTLLTFAALYMLFQPDAKEWFAEKRNRS